MLASELGINQKDEVAIIEEQQNALYIILCEFDRICKKLGVKYYLFAGTLLGAVRHKDFIPWDDDVDVIMFRDDYERYINNVDSVINSKYFYAQNEFTEHWPMFFSKMRLNDTACLEKHHPKDHKTHQGVYIDIFPCDNAYNHEIGRRFQFLCSKVIIAKGLDGRGYYTESKIKKMVMMICRAFPQELFMRFIKGPKGKTKYVHSFLGAASKYSKNVYKRKLFNEPKFLCFRQKEFPVPTEYDQILTVLYEDYMKMPPEDEREYKSHSILVDLRKSYEHYEGYRDGMKFDIPIRSIR